MPGIGGKTLISQGFSHVADADCLFERSDGVGAGGDEFLGDVAFEAGLDDGFHDRGVVEFLRFVDLVAAGDAAGVVVGEVLVLAFDRGDDVALHDLHVVDVVEQLEIGGADLLAQLDAPRAFVALVIGMVHPAVEQFHDEDDVAFFANSHEALEAFGAIFEAGFVVHFFPISRETDEVFHARVGDSGDLRLVGLDEQIVMLFSIPRALDAAERFSVGGFHGRIADHGAGEVVFFQRWEIGGLEQVDGSEAQRFPGGAQVIEADFRVAPFAGGVVDVSLCADGGGGGGEALGEGRGGERGRGSGEE